MTVTEVRNAAVAWAREMATDDTHGYDQAQRWGERGDYDCSSLVISAYKKAGVPLTCTYTGNMKADMLTHGFSNVTSSITLSTGKGLKKGDVLLHETYHTALYIGDGKIVHAAGNEYGRATGGKPGDQTGKEICVANYYNMPWQVVLRYAKVTSVPTGSRPYTIKAGDSLWAIAERELGAGYRYPEIMKLNNLTEKTVIVPGQVIYLPGGEEQPPAQEETETTKVSVELPVLKQGDSGEVVRVIQLLLLNAGISVGDTGADGDFGENTWVAVCDLQREHGTTVNGIIKSAEWRVLLGL